MKIENLMKKYNNDVVEVKKAIRSLQSKKSRLVKQKGIKDYDKIMSELLVEIQDLCEVRDLLTARPKTVPEYDADDVAKLDYDETVKAIKTIQSKKTHTRWLTDVEGDNDEFKRACEVERMLQEHKEQIKPVDEYHVRKSEVQTMIETIENNEQLSKETVLELLKKLL